MYRLLVRSTLAVSFLLASGLGAQASAAQPNLFDVAGTTVEAPVALFPLFGSTAAACTLGDTPEPYDATAFTTDTDGTHTIDILEPIQTIPNTDDTILFVYDGAFNPDDACDNFLGIGNETPETGMSLDLTAGGYVLVVAGFLGTEDAYTVRLSGPEGSTIEGEQPPISCSLDAPLAFGDFDTDGNDVTYGEFAEIVNSSTSIVDLTACSFATFDPATETVIYTAEATGSAAGMASYVFATMNGDQALPPESIFDAPGAFVLIEGTTVIGATAADVLPKVVAGLVYRAEDDVYAQMGGGASTAEREAFAMAFSQPVSNETVGDETDLAMTSAPNPLSQRSTVSFGVAEAIDVRIVAFDALGREVATIADAPFSSGRHTVMFEASHLPEGLYLLRLTTASGQDATLRLTLLR